MWRLCKQEHILWADVITLIYPKTVTSKKGLIINTHGTPKEIYDSIGMTESLKKTSDTGIFD